MLGAWLLAAGIGVSTQTRAMDRIREFLSEGSFAINVRPRYEQVESTNDETANALTVRTRVGYLTRMWRGVTAFFEAENVASPFPNGYNQSQLNPNGSAKAIVTDPTGTNISQAWLGYTRGKTSVKVGRQRLTLDNGRFIGDYDWRQHLQTFDSVVIEDNSFNDLSLTYAYIARVNRVFGPRHPQGVYDSNSHILHASYRGFSAGTLSGYAYLLDFKGSVIGNSCATYGLNFDGARKFDRIKVGYRAEYAIQSDYGNSPLFYSTIYLAAEVMAGLDSIYAGVGYEKQNSDNNFAFRTPLASLHAFNGWADVFVLTPAQGLSDTYWKAGGRLPWRNIDLEGSYHSFDSYSGLHLGKELDLQASYQINESLGALVKYASFSSASNTLPDVKKIWLQLELKY